MKLVLFGANGPTGRLATQMAIAGGHAATAVTRRPRSFPQSHPMLRVAEVDAMDAEAVDGVVAGQDAVISILGVPYQREPVKVFSRGVANIVNAMGTHRVRRLVCVSSMATSGEYAPGESFFFRKVVGPVLLRMGRTVYEDLHRMEAIVGGSGLDWTVIRASGLFDGTGVTNYQASPHRLPGRFTSRVDLADALLREAVENRHVGQFIDLVTTQGTPSFAGMLMKEALHLGK